MLDQRQQLEQKQSLSARQIQQIQLLELPVLELEQRIRAELERNPALEEDYSQSVDGDESSAILSDEQFEEARQEARDDYASEDDIPSYRLNMIAEREKMREEIPFADHGVSLQDYLEEQLSTLSLTPRQQEVVPYIIGNLRDDGYLDRGLGQIAQDLLVKESLDVSEGELQELLQIIQSLDPGGVGARDLQECLLLQIERMPSSPDRDLAERILRKYFDDFANRRFERLAKRGIDAASLERATKLIVHLNPKPGNGFDASATTLLSKITPDFVITNQDGELILSLTDQREIPSLQVSPAYNDMLAQYRDASKEEKSKLRETIQYAREKINQAEWFMSALQQRFDTLRTTMTIIMHLQRDYFLSGDIADLRPMILKDVAELANIDISTVSRVSNSKYVQCDWGIYPLKYFFSESITNVDGVEVSTKIIKDRLQQIIDGEDSRTPLTDDQLVDALSEHGFSVARRTVAKYRKMLDIPTARMRRKLS